MIIKWLAFHTTPILISSLAPLFHNDILPYPFCLKYHLLVCCFFILYSCGVDTRDASSSGEITFLETPCVSGGEPNLSVSADGKAMLSWIEYDNDTTDILLCSTLTNNTWSL